jgi:hypothetical protein
LLFLLNIQTRVYRLRRLVLLLIPRRLELRRVLFLAPPFFTSFDTHIPRFFRILLTRSLTTSGSLANISGVISDAI